ncbi:hypothetical protein BDN70DRAFT_769316, partial [Pholiota conissans]
LEPTTPAIYRGDEDEIKYMTYVLQCRRFCREARLPPDEQVMRCSDFLEGNALHFYTSMVALNEHEWTLDRFFMGLFDHCFSADFRLRKRRQLDAFYQGPNMTVQQYAAEVSLMFKIIGSSNPEQRVDKLWSGMRSELRTALWKEGLDMRASSWDEV